VLLAAALAAGAAATGEDYEIRFLRPARVGDRYRLVADSLEELTITRMLGQRSEPSRTSKIAGQLDAEARVLEIDTRARERTVRLVISDFSATSGEGQRETLPRGTVVTAALRGQETVFVRDDGPLGRLTIAALRTLVSLDGGETTDDDVLGTTRRRVPGDRWPVDAQAAARDMLESTVPVDPSKVQGTVKLERVEETGGEPCAVVSAEMRVEGYAPPLPGGTPDSLRLVWSELTLQMLEALPLDPRRPAPFVTVGISLSATFRGIAGEGMEMEVRLEGRRGLRRDVLVVEQGPAT
jgi:hypothetical protein